MIRIATLKASSHRWDDPISMVLKKFLDFNEIKREQIISIGFPDMLTCIVVFEEVV